MTRVLRTLRNLAGYGLLGVMLTVLVGYVVYLARLLEPNLWHVAKLDAEFRASDAAAVKSLDDYRQIEDRVFAQLRERVYARVPADERRALNRFSSGSLADPLVQQPNWNRTFELLPERVRGGVLLLHGLTDSPYSLRALGEQLQAVGFRVVGLRLPGHGTAPSGLLDFTWQDMAAAVRVGARHLRAELGPELPLYVAGYSMGAALAVEYALARLQGEDVPAAAGLLLFSPAIGVAPAAGLAAWQSRLAAIPWLENAAWTAVVPGYDPYKYTSFSVNAAVQIHALTEVIRRRMEALGSTGNVRGMPPIIAFQSVADNTVSTRAVVDALFRRLAPEGHALVLFDVDRHAEVEPLLRRAALEVRTEILDGPALPFDLTVLTNEARHTDAVVPIR